MPVEKFQNKYRIGTKRASWHDYNGGEYFITICAKDRNHYFGEIVDGEMQLSAEGKYMMNVCKKFRNTTHTRKFPNMLLCPTISI